MLRGSERKEALASSPKVQLTVMKYRLKTPEDEIIVFLLRQKCSKDLIARGKILLIGLANTPKEFDKIPERIESGNRWNLITWWKNWKKNTAHHDIGKGTAAAGLLLGAGSPHLPLRLRWRSQQLWYSIHGYRYC